MLMKVLFKDIGKYQQAIWIEKEVIVDMQCTCMHGSIHRLAWEGGEKICKHLMEVIHNAKGLQY